MVRQTVIRRLGESQACLPSMNPMIEIGDGAKAVPRTRLAAGPGSPGVVASILPGDAVLPCPPLANGPLPKRFVEAMRRVQGLQQEHIDALCATIPADASQYVDNCLCAVRDVFVGRVLACYLPKILIASVLCCVR
jgi:hypothetical protein